MSGRDGGREQTPASLSIDDAPAVIAVQQWLRLPLPSTRPSAEVIEDLLGIAIAGFEGRERLVEQRDQARRLYELVRDGYAELEREVERLHDEVHGYKMERDQAWQVGGLLREQLEAALAVRDQMKQAEQQVIDTFLASENERLRAERNEARVESERWKQASVANLLAKVTMPLEERDRLLAERDEARRLARWLYHADGQEVLEANGASDVSESPWLLEDE